ncbi:MAG: hypothetical protein ACXVIP_03320 [Halobacteriota archaeon]
MKDFAVRGWERDPGIVNVKRGAALTKYPIVLAIIFASVAIFAANLGNAFLQGASDGTTIAQEFALFSGAMTALAATMLTMPVTMLYVYDKNNGVLEYLLALGMNPGDVYKRYLKAELILVSLLLIAVAGANAVVGLILRGDVLLPLAAAGIAAVLAFPVVSFVTMAMMAFSSLQRQRAGANQPLALSLGVVLLLPLLYVTPWFLPFIIGVVVDLAEAVVIAALAISLLLLSSRFISREKLLP